jgi:hypothetical protein
MLLRQNGNGTTVIASVARTAAMQSRAMRALTVS